MASRFEPFLVKDFEVVVYGVPFLVNAWVEPGYAGDEIDLPYEPDALIESVRVKGSLADISEHISDRVAEHIQTVIREAFDYSDGHD